MSARYRICAPAMALAPQLLLVLLLLPSSGAIYDAEQEVAILTARVGTALASEQRLAAKNEQLQHEVDSWKDVGARVMNREAQFINAIKQSGGADQPSLRAAIVAGLAVPESSRKPMAALDVGKTSGAAASKAEEHLPPSLVSWHLFVLGFTVLATVAVCWARATGLKFSGLLRREKLLEISELQLEGVPSGFGEGYVLVQPSGGLRSRTRVAEQIEDSSVLRFNEVLTIAMRKGDSPCTVTVFRRGEVQDTRIGTATLEASDLLGCGPEAPCQYFRFKVHTEVLSPNQQIHVAMRIRDLTGVPGAWNAKAGLSIPPQSDLHTNSKGRAFAV